MYLGKIRFSYYLYIFIIDPLFYGLYGYAILFTIIIITKLYHYLIITSGKFIVEMGDMKFCLLGIIPFFIIKLVGNVKKFNSERDGFLKNNKYSD